MIDGKSISKLPTQEATNLKIMHIIKISKYCKHRVNTN